VQLEQLKQDNERLIEMLSQTDKFADFANFAKDSGGMMVYLGDPENPRTRCHYPKPKNKVRDIRPEEEMADWVPEEAFRLAHDFRTKNGNKIGKTLINQLLMDLNTVWKNREASTISRIRSEASQQVQYLRRQLNSKKPFQQVELEQEVRRLKTQLNTAQQALRENVAVIQETDTGLNKGLLLVDQTVSYTNQIQQERRRLQTENEELKEKLAKAQGQEPSSQNFYEGAAWAAKQAVQKCDEGVNAIKDLR